MNQQKANNKKVYFLWLAKMRDICKKSSDFFFFPLNEI